jgi:phosphohistidine phosphatase SixA
MIEATIRRNLSRQRRDRRNHGDIDVRRSGGAMKHSLNFSLLVVSAMAVGALLVVTDHASAQTLSGAALVRALRQGGYVIVMRHASSPREVPNAQMADPDNVKLERQLDEAGREASVAMGRALRDLKLPIGDVLTSPTYRALETVRLAQLPNPRSYAELGDGGQSMQGATSAQATWLRERVTDLPAGTNTIIVTHMPNISQAFPAWGTVADGEAVIVGAGGRVVGRIKIDDWPRLKP